MLAVVVLIAFMFQETFETAPGAIEFIFSHVVGVVQDSIDRVCYLEEHELLPELCAGPSVLVRIIVRSDPMEVIFAIVIIQVPEIIVGISKTDIPEIYHTGQPLSLCFGSLSMRIFASSTKLLLHICFWIICSLCLFIQRPKGFDPEGGTLLDKKAPLPPRSLFPFPLKKTKPSPSAPPTAGRYPQNLGTSSLETAAFVGIFHPC